MLFAAVSQKQDRTPGVQEEIWYKEKYLLISWPPFVFRRQLL